MKNPLGIAFNSEDNSRTIFAGWKLHLTSNFFSGNDTINWNCLLDNQSLCMATKISSMEYKQTHQNLAIKPKLLLPFSENKKKKKRNRYYIVYCFLSYQRQKRHCPCLYCHQKVTGTSSYIVFNYNFSNVLAMRPNTLE